MAAPALSIEGLSYAYGRGAFALKDVALTVEAGSFTALLGPNGAGKTTLFALITRLFESPGGTIRIGGADLRREPTRALARMGVVFQQPTLDLDLTVRQNLLYFAALHGIPRRTAQARALGSLEQLGMAERIDETVRTLNGGHRRRVELARALLHEPALLVLDEPTVGLDVPARRAIVEHVHSLCRERGIAVLWATHLIDEIAPDDRVVVIHKGQIRASGPVADVNRDTGADTLTDSFNRLIAKEAA
ncbi:ABC transporter ATP-binding protein [Azospirillum soli]|uniref:ABC transporter ATP-binding protein n=1 Tax=Azospirillum soli TaxID=1304799 RepID=UPI001AE7923B|nr:ABC transporter ATP-binding protein [Azospirillum soli]MBP2313288.1 ABC-2 type transport system ATP-binding protein [Azospirillum soli]